MNDFWSIVLQMFSGFKFVMREENRLKISEFSFEEQSDSLSSNESLSLRASSFPSS